MWARIRKILGLDRLASWIRLEPLLEKGAGKNWGIILIVLVGALAMIYSSHRYEGLLKEYEYLQKKEKIVRSVYIKWKSQNARYKLQSNVAKEVETWGIYPSKYPPSYIELKKDR